MKKPVIYIERQRGLGDVLWIEPVIRQLATLHRRVVVFSEYNVLFENYPFPNVVFKRKLNRPEKFIRFVERKLNIRKFFIDLEGAYEASPKMHFLHAYQDTAGVPRTDEYPRLRLSESELKLFADMPRPFVLLHLDTWSEKNYRQVFGIDWSEAVDYLHEKNFHVVQIGKQSLDIPGATYVKVHTREMIALISKSSLFIGIDSGPSHLAASFGIPSLLFFGAVNPAFRHFPNLFNGFFLQQPCEFGGCYHEMISLSGPVCRLVGDEGIPKCSVHTMAELKMKIDQLLVG